MRASRLNIVTLREDPSDAEIASHRLLTRAGFLHKSGAGLYLYAPLLKRVVDKVADIVAEEIAAAGGLEVTMPIMQEQALWEKSGRWAAYQASRTMLTVRDRNDQVFGLAPTAEEVVTDYAAGVLKSYKQLPVTFFQQHTKFRDEIRPRFGLMRGREFVMKDGYSFHATYEDTLREYENMRQAYSRIFRRCGLRFRAVEADTGNIGGSLSHEFQVLAESGEDLIVSCSKCEYAANVEKAENRPVPAQPLPDAALSEVPTPGARTIEEVSAFLSRPPEHFIKTLILMADEQGIAVLLRGDDQLSEPKLKAMLGATVLRMAEPAEVERLTGAPQGFAGPVGLKLPMYADYRLSGCRGMVSGANKNDTHVVGVSNERDFSGVTFANLRTAAAGDACARCEDGVFEEHRGIEVGHVFYLGKKYSQKLGATYLDDQGNAQVMEMGTYGIGVTRTMAAAVEQHHDDKGIRWPISLAPFEVVIVAVKWDDEPSRVAATSLHDALQAAGVEVLLDDRDERAGVKFNDADLIGIPFRITIGPRGLKEGKVELKERSQAQAQELTLEGAAADVIERVRRAHAELRQ